MATSTSTPADKAGFDLHSAWQLHPRVALRPEPFGALAYHYDNRRLNFVRSKDLVRVLESLEQHSTASEALIACDVNEARWPAFAAALNSLRASNFVQHQLSTS